MFDAKFISWFEQGLVKGDTGYLERGPDVPSKPDANGNYIRTPFNLCTEIVQHIKVAAGDLSEKTVLVVDTVEFIPVLLTLGVNKHNITYVAPYVFKGKIASALLGTRVNPEQFLIWVPPIDPKTGKLMKFDVIVGNPPYQPPNRDGRLGSRGLSELWALFVKKSIDTLLKEKGHLSFIHPTSWRKPEDRNGFWKLLTSDNQLEYLVMSSGKGKQDWFGTGIRVDYYVLNKQPRYKNTSVIDHESVLHNLDLSKFEWLPNYAISEISELLGQGCTVLYDTKYHTQKEHSDHKTTDFIHPVVHTINRNGLGIRYFKYKNLDSIHFGVPKVLLNQNEIQYPYNDYNGEYGMSQLTFGIKISSKEMGDEIIDFLNSPRGKRLISATKWNTFYTDYGMFKSFKSTWYK